MLVKCPHCKGTGKVKIGKRTFTGILSVSKKCSVCYGAGEIERPLPPPAPPLPLNDYEANALKFALKKTGQLHKSYSKPERLITKQTIVNIEGVKASVKDLAVAAEIAANQMSVFSNLAFSGLVIGSGFFDMNYEYNTEPAKSIADEMVKAAKKELKEFVPEEHKREIEL